jgi:hypothetical protein
MHRCITRPVVTETPAIANVTTPARFASCSRAASAQPDDIRDNFLINDPPACFLRRSHAPPPLAARFASCRHVSSEPSQPAAPSLDGGSMLLAAPSCSLRGLGQ